MVAGVFHVQSHLLVGGGASGQIRPRFQAEILILPTHTPRPESRENPRPPVWSDYGCATPTRRPTKPANLRVADRSTLLSRGIGGRRGSATAACGAGKQ